MAALCFSHTSAERVQAGLAIATDALLIKNVKNYMMPMILKTVNDLSFQRVDFDGGYADKIALNLNVKDNNSVSLSFNQKSNGAILRAFNIQGEITGVIRYKVLFVTVDANFRVTFDYGAVTMQTTLPLST